MARRGVGIGRSRVSIHAPARGATVVTAATTVELRSFNPRPREGRRPGAGARVVVSIHAPARGDVMVGMSSSRSFQSTPPRGATSSISLACAAD